MTATTLKELAKPVFARHETFSLRQGWLQKAYANVSVDDEVFLREDATVRLGVGKNMVNAMRYWANAFKLTVEHPKGGTSRANTASPTWEARWLLDEAGGADPYLEDPGSLWLLHWWLLAPTCNAPTWWVAFNVLPTAKFTEHELGTLVLSEMKSTGWEAVTTNSIKKDTDCLTKTYAPRMGAANSPGSFEDLLGCPLLELGLIEPVGNASRGAERVWRFTSTRRTSLPAKVMTYACLDYAARTSSAAGSVSTARLANEPGAPGRAFCVREPELFHALEEVCSEFPSLRISEAVGNRMLVFDRDPAELAWDVLDSHYGNVRAAEGFPTRQRWLREHPDLAAALVRGNKQSTSGALQEVAV